MCDLCTKFNITLDHSPMSPPVIPRLSLASWKKLVSCFIPSPELEAVDKIIRQKKENDNV